MSDIFQAPAWKISGIFRATECPNFLPHGTPNRIYSHWALPTGARRSDRSDRRSDHREQVTASDRPSARAKWPQVTAAVTAESKWPQVTAQVTASDRQRQVTASDRRSDRKWPQVTAGSKWPASDRFFQKSISTAFARSLKVTLDSGVFELGKVLPGQRAGSQWWYEDLTSVLCAELQMKQCEEYPNLLCNDDRTCMVLLHVDDMLVCGKKDYVLNRFVSTLQKHYKISASYLQEEKLIGCWQMEGWPLHLILGTLSNWWSWQVSRLLRSLSVFLDMQLSTKPTIREAGWYWSFWVS